MVRGETRRARGEILRGVRLGGLPGTVAASVVARETGFKEGQAIRVFPFGYVAHDEAANPQAQLDLVVTVGVDGVVREIAVT